MRSSGRSRAHGGRVSITLVLSYVFDWFVITLAVGLGYALSIISPHKRPFSLSNPEISFPFTTRETISPEVAGYCACVAPAAIIFVVCFLFVPGPTVPKSTPKALIWRRKLWEWHTGWLGLALALAASFLITNGMKNLFGKPRPDLLSRCDPDLANIERYIVGDLPPIQGVSRLVSAAICRQSDNLLLDDGFRSYPSGHASISAAGLIYLSLFLASKLAITIPFLATSEQSIQKKMLLSAFPSRAVASPSRGRTISRDNESDDKFDEDRPLAPSGHNDTVISARNQAAAPPVYLLALAVIPFFLSIFISSTRYSDFRHHGFDILFGYFIGTVSSVFAFRYYHLPINQGAGWSWGPRSGDRSFWAGVGVGSYAGLKPDTRAGGTKGENGNRDVELGELDHSRAQSETGRDGLVHMLHQEMIPTSDTRRPASFQQA